MAAIIKDLAQLNAELQEQKDRADTVDFKMVTFSLGGKDYGVDIMNVKEIAKADKFTFVPNAASFVRGVYNLRGDIIPIIDLRLFFHIPQDRKADGLENMLILSIEDRVYGTIVDKIDKVVGINTENIQPPHPIFGDINIKFISGVVEKQGDLYVILDVIRIFSQKKEEEVKPASASIGAAIFGAPAAADAVQPSAAEDAAAVAAFADTNIGFIKESLLALRKFHPTGVNEEWIRKRFADWSGTRSGEELQLKNERDADEYLSSFYSPDAGRFWSDDYASAVKSYLPELSSNNVQVWDIGCGKGYETFSFACILKTRYPDGHIKIWANDNDIMAISQATNMVFDLEDVPEYCKGFMIKGRTGYSFNQAVKDSIVFEYHDVLNDNPLPDLDIILARDIVSFLQPQDQIKVLSGFGEKLKDRGIVFLGRNEVMSDDSYRAVGNELVSAFVRN
ncbi:CheR family methyltransferase [Leadbettera azotonutricia]|uniref:Chemotaxis protein CheW n=1 Tax=Leadbettera azotonutricia (strain ATCC BAA-888 / DSM 13862 / ZAS-9) TaxID=545695 RepID=F5YG11_LEAAZ|nr:CheR family methyltransferase [Leadbettera azotonutricia]AEF83086.1 chemotaxis protein CheW [Leadbettera azotonutricia ZAS-9]